MGYAHEIKTRACDIGDLKDRANPGWRVIGRRVKVEDRILLLLGIDLRNLDGGFNRFDKHWILAGSGNIR
jgi:hypothetical protein